MVMMGNLANSALTETNNKEIFHRDVETDTNSDANDIGDLQGSEELLTKLVEIDEVEAEDGNSEDTDEYAQIILPGGSTIRSGRFIKLRNLQD